MATLTETIDTMDASQADIRETFSGVRAGQRAGHPDYERRLVEAWQFTRAVESGKRPLWQLREALSTSDFQNLFGDILQRQLLDRYSEWPTTWDRVARRSTVPDFRSVKRYAVDDAEGQLEEVAERGEYPETSLSDSVDTLSVTKYGRRIDLSWEAMVNDDLDAFRTLPDRLARGARRTEDKQVTQLYIDSSGPHASLYTGGNSNIVTSNPVLTTAALQTAFSVLAAQTDEDGEPILIEGVELVVPPALEVTAQNILNAISIDVNEAGGSTNQTVRAQNWMAGRVRLTVNPYIPIVASTNGSTSWFLFANPSSGRAALEAAFLTGNEQPALWRKLPNATPVGGGGDPLEDFATDSIAWRVRHVFGTARLLNTGGAKATVASDGSGA